MSEIQSFMHGLLNEFLNQIAWQSTRHSNASYKRLKHFTQLKKNSKQRNDKPQK